MGAQASCEDKLGDQMTPKLNLGLWSLWFFTDTEDTKTKSEDITHGTRTGDEEGRPSLWGEVVGAVTSLPLEIFKLETD